MTTAAELAALQEIDLALDRDLARLAAIEESLGESDELIQAREKMEQKQAVVAGLRSRQADLEWSVDEVRAKALQVEGKLYGGSIRNPKELQDLQADLQSLQAQTSKREDDLLAVLMEADEAQADAAAAESAYRELEARWQEEQRSLRAEKEALEPEIAELQAKRAAQIEGIDRSALSLYETLRERKGGQAVARVERGMCQGCRITLPMSLLQRARSGAGLVQCVSCERILFVS